MKKLLKRIKELRHDVPLPVISAYSASGAYFIFLSIVPISFLLTALLPYTPVTQEMLLRAMAGLLPESMVSLLSGVVDDVYRSSSSVLPLTIILTLWSAGKAMMSLMRGMDEIYCIPLEKRRNGLLRRLQAVFYTVLLMILVVVTFVLLVLGGHIIELLQRFLPDVELPSGLITVLRYALTLCVLVVVFALIFKWAPETKLRLRDQWLGAAVTSLGWVVFSLTFSAYLSISGGFSTYGRLAGIIVAMMWMYWCTYIVLIGCYIARRTAEKRGR